LKKRHISDIKLADKTVMGSKQLSDSSIIKSSPIPGERYSAFKDLSALDAVRMPARPLIPKRSYKEEQALIIHLTVTGRCYARCKDCVNSAVTMGCDDPRNAVISAQEAVPERDSSIIKKLAERHPGQVITVCFYGGEPFLRMELMERVWRILKLSDRSSRFRFVVYTNGELLTDALKRYPELMRNMWLYSVSIDGDEEQHDRIRLGTRLSNIKENLRNLSSSCQGNILFWSTLREEQSLSNCFQEFMRMYKEGLVHHFFWHWAENRYPMNDFSGFVSCYGREMEQIMDVYVQKISTGEILPITHINELLLYLLTAKERGHSACGVELAKNYDIVSGKVFPCADLPSCLSIGKYNLSSLVEYKNWLGCYQCGVGAYCGGRCPVQIHAGSLERTYQYCQLMRLHVGIVQQRIGEVNQALERNRITLQQIYDKSAFLAQYTDVVP
jgi:sulfatase maturation enzyme AslB (radical SAM superfamily)